MPFKPKRAEKDGDHCPSQPRPAELGRGAPDRVFWGSEGWGPLLITVQLCRASLELRQLAGRSLCQQCEGQLGEGHTGGRGRLF